MFDKVMERSLYVVGLASILAMWAFVLLI